MEQAAQGDMAARNKLIEHNLRLVAHIVKKVLHPDRRRGRPDQHWHHRPDQGGKHLPGGQKIKLTTYAARCIENEILMYLRKTRKLAGGGFSV